MAMYEGNWKCSGCGGEITQLPFQPRSDAGLTCRSCYAKGQDRAATSAPTPGTTLASETPDIPDEAGIATEPPPLDDAFIGMEGLEEMSTQNTEDPVGSGAPATKPKITGAWTCSGCGGGITSLPFTPRTTNNLKCLDCFKASKN